MNRLRFRRADTIRYALAALAGLLWAASLPKPGAAAFAWLAPALMLFSVAGLPGGQCFRTGYVAGLIHALASLSWLLHIPVNKLAPLTGWLALAAYLALYPAVWVWLCWRLLGLAEQPRHALGAGPPQFLSTTGDSPGLLSSLDALNNLGWSRRLAWAAFCAACWVALEMVRGRLLTGFPWNPLGASQYEMVPLIQIATVTGVYGVSFLVVWGSVSLLCAAAVVLRPAQPSQRWMAELIFPLLVMLAVTALGFRQVVQVPRTEATLKIALIQPSIPQRWIWAPEESARRFDQLLQLSEQALTNRPDLLVWPEAAVPSFVRWNTNINQAVRDLVRARAHRTWLILGADDLAPAAAPRHADDYDVFNSSFLVSPAGEFLATYRKRRLVIFGEYIPLGRHWPWLERVTGMGSFSAGDKPVPFAIPELRCKTSVLICFEDVFPHLAREHVEADTDFLLNLTNNGWFGESAAQWQHAANAVFRAVENGLPLVRCANNGLTCWVDPQGRLHEVFFPRTRDIYGVGTKVVRVPLLAGRERGSTFYWRHGDWFGWGCVWLSFGGGALTFVRRRAGSEV